MNVLSGFELGYLVGLLEGEGSFGYYSGTQRIYLAMIDEDSVNRVAGLCERIIGRDVHVYERPPYGASKQIAYEFHINGHGARMIMRLIVRHMSYRRRQRIWQNLNGFQPAKINVIDLLQIKQGQ